ncbi:MAG: ribosomal-protein-alanine acetyltransferase [Chthonomonadaceae bacterium]|nr:ribosomal-protein-alanine acetyltransferase [Chthonomonadaceae bacterium]
MSESNEHVSIEPMRAEVMEAVLYIDRLSFPVPWMPTAFTTLLSNRSASYLVARSDAQVVGFGGAWVIRDEAHITTLAVHPQHRGHRIGERLLLALLEEGIRRRATRATLEVRQNNRVARKLYQKFGFYEASIRKNYYTDNGENAIVMWADNIHSHAYRDLLAAVANSIEITSR